MRARARAAAEARCNLVAARLRGRARTTGARARAAAAARPGRLPAEERGRAGAGGLRTARPRPAAPEVRPGATLGALPGAAHAGRWSGCLGHLALAMRRVHDFHSGRRAVCAG